jgi:hypothetical protein
MAIVTASHRARVTTPIVYLRADGTTSNIPIGPCLVEQIDRQSVDVIWGESGQRCAALPLEEVELAEGHGHLVLLD